MPVRSSVAVRLPLGAAPYWDWGCGAALCLPLQGAVLKEITVHRANSQLWAMHDILLVHVGRHIFF